MARGNDWPRGLRAIVHQCALEQGDLFHRDVLPVIDSPSDDSPWRLAANRHMVFYALNACLDQYMPLPDAFEFLRDDFRDNGHETLAATLAPWAGSPDSTGSLRALARQIAPYSLESAARLLTLVAWGSEHAAIHHVEAQSARELRRERNEPLDPIDDSVGPTHR